MPARLSLGRELEYRHYHILSFDLSASELAKARDWLYRRECLGVENSQSDQKSITVRAYFTSDRKIKALLESLTERFPKIQKIRTTTIGLRRPRAERRSFEPFPLVEDVWVLPPNRDFAALDSSQRKIFLQPGLAFGSGRHETTQMTAQLMEHLRNRPTSMLDIGTGTGILAIYGRMLGIEKIDTVEISEEARENAKENFKENDLSGIHIYRDLRRVKDDYELILANLLTPTLIYLKDEILSHLTPNASLILSGITHEEAPEIRRAFGRLRLEKQIQQGNWVGMLLKSGASN